MEESNRQLNLLGRLVAPEVMMDILHWGDIRGGYFLNVYKHLVLNSKGTYQWSAGRYGNISALSKDGSGLSLDHCVRQAQLAIVRFIHESEEVERYILHVEESPEITPTRYQRDPVI
jgi:hypothetical protein